MATPYSLSRTLTSRPPLFTTAPPLTTPLSSLLPSLASLSLHPHPQTQIQVRHAGHASQGRANGPAQGPGKRLGAKKSDTELVVPGNIIFRQRGSLWHPGENCVMGRDHTISALVKGYVRYYRDPERHKKRKYIGVVFERNETLPRPRGAPRRRRVGMEGVRILQAIDEGGWEGEDGVTLGENVQGEGGLERVGWQAVKGAEREKEKEMGARGRKAQMKLKPGYMYRESNAEIGRAMEGPARRQKKYVPGDRWLAWRKRTERKERVAEMKLLKKRKK